MPKDVRVDAVGSVRVRPETERCIRRSSAWKAAISVMQEDRRDSPTRKATMVMNGRNITCPRPAIRAYQMSCQPFQRSGTLATGKDRTPQAVPCLFSYLILGVMKLNHTTSTPRNMSVYRMSTIKRNPAANDNMADGISRVNVSNSKSLKKPYPLS